MKKQFISPKGVYEWPSYSQVVKVNNTIYVSGQAGIDEQGKIESGFEAQALKAFENMERVLKAVGASFKDVVEINGLSDAVLVTAAQAVNTIPHVVQARPGWLSPKDLPPFGPIE